MGKLFRNINISISEACPIEQEAVDAGRERLFENLQNVFDKHNIIT